MSDAKTKKATHSGELKIGDTILPCYVLEDGTRVFSQRGVQSSIGMSVSGSTVGVRRLVNFIERYKHKANDNNDLMARLSSPLIFLPPHGGRTAYGFEATVLSDFCDFVLTCRENRILLPSQQHIAEKCEILIRGFANVGIIALVDEATGYQEVRARKALEEILEKFIAKELRKWTKTFSDEFFREIFRLKGLPYSHSSVKRPQYFGRLINNLVYERLAPGVLSELKKKNPKTQKGHRKHKHHQWLTEGTGHPKLREHIHAVTALMRAASNWRNFESMINRALPKYIEMPLFEWAEEEERERQAKK